MLISVSKVEYMYINQLNYNSENNIYIDIIQKL